MIKKALLWKKVEAGNVECLLCSHRCVIPEGEFGFCGMRQNRDGGLYTHAYGNVIASHVDPIEKKPFYHFMPGTYAYSVAAIGCNFRCGFCQNWSISQVSARDAADEGYEMKPREIVREAIKNGCRGISYTYTEPTVFFEYARETAIAADGEGLANSFVSNGYMTPEAIEEIRPWLDAANIDLKFFKDDSYRKMCGGRLAPVLDSIRILRDSGIWVEVTTLVIPDENDSEEELADIAGFLAGLGRDIPWHISRYHPDFKHTSSGPTPESSMRLAKELGERAGLKYIYLGNVADAGKTLCPGCGNPVVHRSGFSSRIVEGAFKGGACVSCGTPVEGVWE